MRTADHTFAMLCICKTETTLGARRTLKVLIKLILNDGSTMFGLSKCITKTHCKTTINKYLINFH